MTTPPYSPATSDLRMQISPAEMAEMLTRAKTVLTEEGNYTSLIMAETIELSWPSIVRMAEELSDLPTSVLAELLVKCDIDHETSVSSMLEAVITSRSYSAVSTLLEERTALLQSCQNPEEDLLTLETPGLSKENTENARSSLNLFFSSADKYMPLANESIKEVTVLLNAHKARMTSVFKERVTNLIVPAYWEQLRFFYTKL